ncbi:MAG: DUF3857 domain-containing protein [Chitinophagaceae bacterium]|nr:MAG: DUF3857 domain-containing protein [Chitinophagaceae bacterium]
MKKLTSLATLLLLSACLFAQKSKEPDLPAFGKIEKSDLEMKKCDYDEKAEAFVLVDNGELTYLFGSGIEMRRRVRIKILNDKGLEWANVKLRYISNQATQDITGIDAQTYNLDEAGNMVITKLEKKLIYEKKVDKRTSEKVFSFPGVKVGSIIEYKYKQSGVGLIDWYFQRSIPVKYSRFSLDFPQEIEVNVSPYCSRDYTRKENNSGTRVEKSFSMSNVPAFRDEPYIINEDYYRDRLETKITAYQENGFRKNNIANWVQVIKFLMEDEDFGVQVKKNIPRTADLDLKLKGLPEPYDRMKAVYNYVQSNMQWNEYFGIWALDGVKSAWKDKKGTAGEINLILINLLKDAGLTVRPILVSTHANGVVNSMDAGTYWSPGYYQFNKVLAYVDLDGKNYVLDATDKTTPIHLVPPSVLLTEALVIDKIETYEWGWKTLFDVHPSRNVVVIRGLINESGKMNGEVSVSSFDYARLDKSVVAKAGKEKYLEQFVTASNPGINIDEVNFENLDSDSLPLVQNFKFNQDLNTTGEYQYFSANILSGLEKNPFVADTRFSDVFFGTNQSYTIVGNFTLPEGYELDALPKNVRMIMSDTSISISRMCQVSQNVLMTRVQLEFKKPVYPATQYEEMQAFYKQLQELLNEQFVIRKKVKA